LFQYVHVELDPQDHLITKEWKNAIVVFFDPLIQVLAIEFVAFAIEFVPLANEFVTLAIEFVTLAIEFVPLAIEFVALARKFVITE